MRSLHTDIGIGAVSSMILGLGDIIWVAHDICANGFNLSYLIIGILFLIGYCGLAYSLHSHHRDLVAHAARRSGYYDNGRQGD